LVEIVASHYIIFFFALCLCSFFYLTIFLGGKIQSYYHRIKVVVVSRLVYRKGVDLLVGTIPKICQMLPDVDFIVGGDGNKLLNLQEMVEREKLEHRVEFLGAVPHVDVSKVLGRGHVFLNCSLTESFCIAILEAASCGLLVVSTNVGGVPEVLPSPDMIVLCDPNVDALVEGVAEAVQRQKNGGDAAVDPFRAHQRVENMYSWGRVAKQTIQVYDRVVAEPPKTFMERLACYLSLGGFSGIVACMAAAFIELVVHFTKWMLPENVIDVVPDLMPFSSKEKVS
jgi:phosphatidylinositol glycan class A protein